VWFSVSRDLKMDAKRDLDDLGDDTKLLNLYPEGDSSLPNAREPLEAHGVKDGVLFMTYSLLINQAGKGGRNCAAGQVDTVVCPHLCHNPMSCCCVWSRSLGAIGFTCLVLALCWFIALCWG
jgi:hypothetical protein